MLREQNSSSDFSQVTQDAPYREPLDRRDREEATLKEYEVGQEVVGPGGQRYEISKVLGQGGMGTAYLAFEKKPKLSFSNSRIVEEGREFFMKPVVIKVIQTKHAVQEKIISRFEREGEALKELYQSPQVVSYFDIGPMQDGTPAIIMEYIEGGDLKNFFKKNKIEPNKTNEDYIGNIALQICTALSSIHKRNITHRDLKPENILVVGGNKTQAPSIKITDFGVVSLVSKTEHDVSTAAGLISDQDAKLTQPLDIIGSPNYVAPEVVQKGATSDYRVDLYSLGAMVYEMLVGHVPHQATNVLDVLLKVCNEEIRPISVVNNKTVMTSFELIVMHLLQKDPDKRVENLLLYDYINRKNVFLKMTTASDVAVAIRFVLYGNGREPLETKTKEA